MTEDREYLIGKVLSLGFRVYKRERERKPDLVFIINLGEDTPVLKQGRNHQYPISLHSTVPATVAKPPYMPPLFKRGCRHRLIYDHDGNPFEILLE